jgi:uncharacterized protein YciW
MNENDTTLSLAGIAGTGPLADAVASRSNIFEMTRAAEAAVLRPREAGRWPHELRAALAARIAKLNGAGDLAGRYAAAAGDYAPVADPACDGSNDGLGPVLAFMDKVAARTRDVAATDIAALQDAGIEDADIVRLCELNAFLAYQLRLIAGLRLMAGGQP